ncbi:ROK family protein [Puteibacter caeruleilacunae]|nr:ROK family protein [Puteibacter caeruleilacunae]
MYKHMNKKIAIGVDVGGSHVCCAAFDLTNMQLIEGTHAEMKVDNKGTTEEIISAWASAIKESIDKAGICMLTGIGFAMPGPFDYVNGISLIKGVNKFENLYGVHVGEEIAGKLNLESDQPVRFINDATAFAVGEAWIGKASSVENVMAITLGTGFGSAFLDKGIPQVEGENIPEMGCVYHLPFKGEIADESFSTRWFVNNYNARSETKVTGVKDIALRYNDDQIARELFNEFGTNLGEFLGPWFSKIGTEMLVMGGNISNAYGLFEEAFKSSLEAQEVQVQIGISELKEEAALVGSARLVINDYYQSIEHMLAKM